MTFGENLRQLRIQKDIGQNQLADMLHISVKTISHWETGYSEPNINQLVALADFFDISTDELLGRKQF